MMMMMNSIVLVFLAILAVSSVHGFVVQRSLPQQTQRGFSTAGTSTATTSSLNAEPSASSSDAEPSASINDIFTSDSWAPIQKDLDEVPVFTVATQEGNPLAYEVQAEDETSHTLPFFYCDVAEALAELEGARNNTGMEGLDILPFPLGQAFQLWATDEAVLIPSKAAILQAGAPPGTNPVGQQVPMFACMEIMEEGDDGQAQLPLFMSLDDANNALKLAVEADGGKVEDFDIACLSLSGAVEQLATLSDIPGFHFIPPSTSMSYIQEYLS
jgi:hypothetical protein